MTELSYGFVKLLPRTSFEEARSQVTAALQREGFGVLTEIDVQATFRKKLDLDFRRYIILGACNPSLAHRALLAEPQVGLLLPCNVVVQEDPGGGTLVSILDPGAVFTLVENPAVRPLAEEVAARVRRVLATLA